MHKPESVQEDVSHKILCDFEIKKKKKKKKDHLIPARKTDITLAKEFSAAARIMHSSSKE